MLDSLCISYANTGGEEFRGGVQNKLDLIKKANELLILGNGGGA